MLKSAVIVVVIPSVSCNLTFMNKHTRVPIPGRPWFMPVTFCKMIDWVLLEVQDGSLRKPCIPLRAYSSLSSSDFFNPAASHAEGEE
jgi:hypothetical protein